MVNTHAYDGKLHDMIKLIKGDLDRVHEINKNKKIEKFKVLRKELETYSADKSDSDAFKYFDIICESIGQPSNYDPTNKLYAGDLLYLCGELLEGVAPPISPAQVPPLKEGNIAEENKERDIGRDTSPEKEGDIGGDSPPDTLIVILLMQLNDMSTGFCAQGRTTRLFQTYAQIKGI